MRLSASSQFCGAAPSAGDAEDRVADALRLMAETSVGIGAHKLPAEARVAIEKEVLAFLREGRLGALYALA